MTADSLALSMIIPPHTASFALGHRLPRYEYLDRLAEYAAAGEAIGVSGAFVYDFPAALDPWLAAFDLMSYSSSLEPVVAVRAHTETAETSARRALDLCHRFARPAHVNAVAGATTASRNPRDDKIAARSRLAKFAEKFIGELERGAGGSPRQSCLVTPTSSTPGIVPADALVTMAQPVSDLALRYPAAQRNDAVGGGAPRKNVKMLVGIVARTDTESAWAAAAELYPMDDRRQQVAGALFRRDLVSSEHARSYALADQAPVHDGCLWFGAPSRGIDAPKLVGSYQEVAAWLNRCSDLGLTDLILDLPPRTSEFEHIAAALQHRTPCAAVDAKEDS